LKKLKKHQKILLILFLLTISIRLFFAFSTPNFTYDSYFHLKHIEHITQEGLPLYHDSLSYGGRNLVFLPAFHYTLSFFDLFLPLEVIAKIIPNLLFASLIFFVYLISKKITQKKDAAMLAAFIAAFIPILWQTNSVSPSHLFLPLTFLAIYSFINISQKKFIYIYLASILLLSLTTSATFILIIGLFFYLLLSKLEEKKVFRAELELTLFSLFLFLWIQFLFFKNTLLTEGFGFIWQNIPSQIISQYYFPGFSLLHSLVLIGLLPLITGIYVIYKSFFKEKNKTIFLLFSLAISTIIMFMFNLIEFKIALMFLGLTLAIIFSQFYNTFPEYLKKTKLTKYKTPFLITIFIILFLTSVYPSISLAMTQQTPSQEETDAFIWLKENTPESSTVLTALKEGHLLTYISQRKNIMDDQFSLIKNIETRFNHLNSLFVTKYQTQAIDLLNQYNINYVLFSPLAKEEYQINDLAYIDEKCFELVHSNVVQIYRSKCQIQPPQQ
jgi:hypothetical protein